MKPSAWIESRANRICRSYVFLSRLTRPGRPQAVGSPKERGHAHTSTRQLEGVGARSRLHGHERVLRAARRGGVARDDRSRARAGRHVARHRGHVRAAHQRAAGRPRAARQAPRSGRGRDQVRHRARRRSPRSRRSTARPDYVRKAIDGSLSRLGLDVRRPVPAITASIRRRRSRTRSARWRIW